MRPPLSPNELREEIAEALADHVKAYDLPSACAALGLDVASTNADPMASKRAYVRGLLFGKSRDELTGIARRIIEEFGDSDLESILGPPGVTGVDGELKNLIFAANGPKPRIVLRDAVNNVIEIVENEQFCLVYDQPLGHDGLSWGALAEWWCRHHDPEPGDPAEAARRLFKRLFSSLQSPPEELLMRTYAARYGMDGGADLPALIPQVYLHYDPYTRVELGPEGEVLSRQRMDFLLLLPDQARVVIEVDGRQHYASGPDLRRADPQLYGEMVKEDRAIRLTGYEVYRFGGAELTGSDAEDVVVEFFDALLVRHGFG